MSIQLLRYILPLFLIGAYLYSYLAFPYRFSKSNNLILPFKCNINFLILIIILVTIETLFILYLSNYIPLSNSFPKYWWLIIPLVTLIYLHLIYSITNSFEDNKDDFVGRPNKLVTKNGRKVILIIMIIVLSISISLEIYLSLKGKIDYHNLRNSIFNNIFYGKDKLRYYIFSWLRFINLAILIYLTYANEKAMCYYKLPFNWND
tara:strand:+ start:628 stop:1242 length:615 start_codon:yes stop_codon:yes gene_type:complete